MAVPVLGFGIAAATGNVVLPGDDLTQNLPLRMLAGHDLAAGRLPLWDPYLWSGTALLGGFNAGALYPFTLLFAVLPPVAAWTIGEAAVYALAATGLFLFLRAEGRSTVASLLAATTFAFAGAMLAQIPHISLVEGLSWLGWVLLAQRGLARSRGGRAWGWVAALGTLGGLVILTGEPRAISDVAVIALVYGIALIWRHRGRRTVIALGSAVALVLAGLLGAVQLLPGLDYLDISQRAHTGYAFFSAGSLPWSALILLGAPYVLGAYQNFGLPAYAGAYNLPEVTSYVGLLPVAAALALLPWGRLRGLLAKLHSASRHGSRRQLASRQLGDRASAGSSRYGAWRVRRHWPRFGQTDRTTGDPVAVWWVLVVVGLLLSVAGETPLGPLLGHIPLYGHQRLQNRNLVELDLGLAVLFAAWVDRVCEAGRFVRPAGTPALERWSALARRVAWAPLAALGVASWLATAWGLGLGPRLGIPREWRVVAGGVAPLLGASGAIALAEAFLVAWLMADHAKRMRWRWLPGRWYPGRWRRWGATMLVALTFADVGLFVLNGNWSTPGVSTIARHNTLSTALARLVGPGGRFAVYDPSGRSSTVRHPDTDALGVPDLNAVHGIPSVQGYGSIQTGDYALVTDTHARGSLAISTLKPSLVRQLDLSALLTLPSYLATPIGPSPIGPPPNPNASPDLPQPHVTTTLRRGGSSSWFLGSDTVLSQASLTLTASPSAHALPHLRVGVVDAAGSTSWTPSTEAWNPTTSTLTVSFDVPTLAVGLAVASSNRAPVSVQPPVVTPLGEPSVTLDGPLQARLRPATWRWAGTLDGFAAFQTRSTPQPYRVEPLGGSPRPQASLEVSSSGDSAEVTTTSSVLLVRSVAFAPGWQAVRRPAGGPHGAAVTSAVGKSGLVQSVVIPRGAWVVNWHYRPPGLRLGLWLGAAGVGALLALVVAAAWSVRRCRRRSPSH